MTITERRQRVWDYMKSGIAASNIAEVLGVRHRTIHNDMQAIRKELLRLELRIGDWVEIKLTHSNAFWVEGKLGRITQIRLSAGEVSVDLNPLSDAPWEQLFRLSDVRKLTPLEVLAKAAA